MTDHHANLTTTSTGIRIGSAYTPPPPAPSRDAEVIQTALLDRETHYAERLLGFIERHSTKWMLAIAAAGFVAGTIKGMLR